MLNDDFQDVILANTNVSKSRFKNRTPFLQAIMHPRVRRLVLITGIFCLCNVPEGLIKMRRYVQCSIVYSSCIVQVQ